ncbi:hypothetical protein ACFLQ0_05610, partial [Nitrospinota bacterium]
RQRIEPVAIRPQRPRGRRLLPPNRSNWPLDLKSNKNIYKLLEDFSKVVSSFVVSRHSGSSTNRTRKRMIGFSDSFFFDMRKESEPKNLLAFDGK